MTCLTTTHIQTPTVSVTCGCACDNLTASSEARWTKYNFYSLNITYVLTEIQTTCIILLLCTLLWSGILCPYGWLWHMHDSSSMVTVDVTYPRILFKRMASYLKSATTAFHLCSSGRSRLTIYSGGRLSS